MHRLLVKGANEDQPRLSLLRSPPGIHTKNDRRGTYTEKKSRIKTDREGTDKTKGMKGTSCEMRGLSVFKKYFVGGVCTLCEYPPPPPSILARPHAHQQRKRQHVCARTRTLTYCPLSLLLMIFRLTLTSTTMCAMA